MIPTTHHKVHPSGPPLNHLGVTSHPSPPHIVGEQPSWVVAAVVPILEGLLRGMRGLRLAERVRGTHDAHILFESSICRQSI